jgi:hypothetical protein
MPENQDTAQEPTQKTPKGLEIPIPTREEFFRNMERVAPPVKHQPVQDEPDDSHGVPPGSAE